MYQLHPRLAADTLPVADLDLCELRLMNDARFPWLILIPKRSGITELHQLSEEEQQQLLRESSRMATALLTTAGCSKINVAALGNMVPQLHWHVVGRDRQDSCWPGPVWGCGQALPYSQGQADTLIQQLRQVSNKP